MTLLGGWLLVEGDAAECWPQARSHWSQREDLGASGQEALVEVILVILLPQGSPSLILTHIGGGPVILN